MEDLNPSGIKESGEEAPALVLDSVGFICSI